MPVLGLMAAIGGLGLMARDLLGRQVRFRKRRRRPSFGAVAAMLCLAIGALALSPSMSHPAASSNDAIATVTTNVPAGAELIGSTVVTEAKPAPPTPVEESFYSATGPITPSRLRIPSIGVDAPVSRVGLLRDGSMGVPDNLWISGWLASSARPGQAGSSVIAGHRGIGTPALFSHLEDVRPGDKIHVADGSRGELVYEVTRVASLDLTVASEVQVFGRTSQQQLVLITCFGQYLRTSRTYDHRLVVFSRLLPPNP
jgi:LPXTG-site transpeptidase (sortase) family protein